MLTDSPRTTASSLVAIAIAARKTHDRDLERAALRLLRDQHGITLRFARLLRPKTQEATR